MLNAADVPGTMAWADMDLEHRVSWWVRRVGALDTLLPALGAVADYLGEYGALVRAANEGKPLDREALRTCCDRVT